MAAAAVVVAVVGGRQSYETESKVLSVAKQFTPPTARALVLG